MLNLRQRGSCEIRGCLLAWLLKKNRVYKEKLAEKQAELDELKLVRKEGGEGGKIETPEPMIVL
jgi:hypothetical protein